MWFNLPIKLNDKFTVKQIDICEYDVVVKFSNVDSAYLTFILTFHGRWTAYVEESNFRTFPPFDSKKKDDIPLNEKIRICLNRLEEKWMRNTSSR